MGIELSEERENVAIADGLIDPDSLRWELNGFVGTDGDGASLDVRNKILARLKEAVKTARTRAEELLMEDGAGLLCTYRLSGFQDELIKVIYDYALQHVYPVENPSSGERMAIVPVGGYGRGTLAPGSDIDLLFLLPYKQTPWGESVVEYILYMLWDLGFKVGHATRNIDECVRLAKGDMTIRTGLLESRFLWGYRPLYDELEERFQNDVVRGTSAEFISAKMEERDQRHRKAGGSRYLVEPNVKEGKGGLRDLQALFWIAKYFYRVYTAEELVKAGIFNKEELKLFVKSEDFLWTVRCHMHFLTGRSEERLSFDLQREMAQRLNYTTHAGLLDVERFMKHYFLVAKGVGDLTNTLSAKLEEEQVKKTPGLNRVWRTFRKQKLEKIKGSDAFALENGRIVAASETVFKDDPVNLIRVFEVADKSGRTFHPNLTHLIHRSLRLINKKVRADKEANEIFLRILQSKRDPETVLRKMNESGVLGKFIPDFGKVVAMMQFNMYHHYTVDEHLLQAVGVLSGIEKGELKEDHPLASTIFKGIDDRLVIYLAIFLHDIAKGREEDHSIAGARVAKQLCKRFGLTDSQIDTVSWLVLAHLEMSIIAQSRDLSDPKTITDFVELVQTPARLKLLLVLTICDIKAVGPGVWNGWKGQLLRTLYYEAEPVLTGGYSEMHREERVTYAKNELAERLSDWPSKERDAYIDIHYPAYLLRMDIDSQVYQAEFVRAAEEEAAKTDNPLIGQFITSERTMSFEGITEISIVTPDTPKLLSTLAGACAQAGANIVGAQVFTTRDGRAIDVVNIRREFNEDEDELRRAGRVSEVIRKALTGEVPLPAKQITGKRRASAKAFTVKTTIAIDNTLSNLFTVLEVSAKDRPGLLYDLTREIAALNLNIASAHIATFGERAVDVFYVTDLVGHKITNTNRQKSIRRRLKEAIEGKAKTKPESVKSTSEAA